MHLLMGGQACVFYGAAEFSRDCDIVTVADAGNFARIDAALEELDADCIAVPPKEWQHLERGHAIHFRCQHPEATGIRLDMMTTLRGCDDFTQLWERRTTVEGDGGAVYELLGIEDLVKAKKTQREKDWPMIRRLVDAHYDQFQSDANDDRVRFWLRESRTPDVLIAVAAEYPAWLAEVIKERPLLVEAMAASVRALNAELDREKAAIMEDDAAYWRPLVKELEAMQREKRNRP